MSLTEAVAQAFAPTPQEFFGFVGGWDTASSPLTLAPGRVVQAQNFEAAIKGGYRRISGYERLDGRTSPSDGAYAILNVTITGSFAAGNTITGVTSAATAVVLEVVTSGTPDYLVITKIVGTFQNAETLNVSGSGQGTTSSTATVDGASTALLHAEYSNLAADEYRDDIAAVPGSGRIRGVFFHNDVKFAFRDNAGATAIALYKSSTSGWTLVPFGEEISFSNANTGVEEGDTLTQGGVTATVKRVVVQTGTLASGVNTGRLILHSRAGGNFAAGAATTTGAGALTLSGAQTAISPAAGGRFSFVSANFGGSVNTKRIYGADGASRGFEFDGSDYSYTPIATGMTTDTPLHVFAHKNHLFFSFVGSVQHSGIGTPYVWSVVSGASEIAMGDTVTGFASQPGSADGGALTIFTRNRTGILYGSSTANWNLVAYREELGAFPYTIQDVGYTMMLDDRGVTNLKTAQSYGNFAHATITHEIQTFINEHRTVATASAINRDRSQYRIFFSDGYALYITLVGGKVIGIMPQLFTDVVRCCFSGELNDGTELTLFGSDDGMVYELDAGTSFDGDAIEYFFELPFAFIGSPRTRKRYRGGVFEITGSGYATFNFTFELGYGSGDAETDATQALVSSFSAGRWDTGTWDIGFWDGRTLLPAEFDLTGTAENIALRVAGNSDYQEPFTIHGALLHYSMRRHLR